MKFSAFVAVSMTLASVSAGPAFVRRASFTLQNGKDAIALKWVLDPSTEARVQNGSI